MSAITQRDWPQDASSAMMAPVIHRLGSGQQWELDEDLWQLCRGGERIPVQPKVLALLFYLARNRDRVVTGSELRRELWPNETVTVGSLARAVSLARSALGDRDPRDPIIETVPRRGYRMLASGERSPPTIQHGVPLVGREAALQALRDDVASVRQGRGRVRILRGEAGIGKTRLADEIVARAKSDGALVCHAWCAPESGQPALWPWMRVARALLDERPASEPRLRASLDQLRSLVAAGGAERSAAEPAAELGTNAGVFATVDGLAVVLARVSVARPVVVVLDDIQWSDLDSLRVFELLAREIADARVYLLAVLRDDELAMREALSHCLAVVERLPHAGVLRLEALSRAETDSLVRAVWGGDASSELFDYVWNAGAGNPLFTTELVRHVRSKGEGIGANGREPNEPPASLRSLLEAKLARASDAARELLAVSAVIGAEIDLGLLVDVFELSLEEMNTRLEELERLGVLAPSEPQARVWRFLHPLARELVLAGLPRGDRARHHARIAATLERRSRANPDAVSSELAGHHLALARAGGPTAAAVAWSERAARIAMRRCAYDESAQSFAGALEALRMDRGRDAREELRLLLALGEAHARANSLHPAAAAAQQAAAHARELSDDDGLARAALLVFVRGPESGGPFDRTVALLEEAEVRMRARSTPLRARVLARLSNELFFVPGTIERRVALSSEAFELASSADLETRIFAGYHGCLGIWSRLRANERAARLGELLELADELGDPSARFQVSAPYIASQLECGRIDEVDAEIDRLSRKVESLSVPSYFSWYPPLYRGMRALYDGQLAEGERLAVAARDLGQSARSQDAPRNFAGQLALVRREQGRTAELLDLLRGMRERLARISVWRAVLVEMLSESGKSEEACAELEAWRADGLPDPLDDSNGVVSLFALGDLCYAEHLRDAAAEVSQKLERYAGENAAPAFGAVCLGPVDRVLGMLALTLGRPDEAVARLREAEGSSERQGARPVLTRVRLALAEALHARARSGDATLARDLAASSFGLAESIGMPTVARRAHALRETLTRHG